MSHLISTWDEICWDETIAAHSLSQPQVAMSNQLDALATGQNPSLHTR